MKKKFIFRLQTTFTVLVIFVFTLPSNLSAQNFIDVTGLVKSDSGHLAGVSVTSNSDDRMGTITDASGNYSIRVPVNSILTFNLVGYTAMDIPVKNRSTINALLKVEYNKLDDVVVVAYGRQKKSSVTAAVSSLSAEKIASLPITNVSNGLGGRVSGIIFKQGSGEPGRDAASIYIRGVSTTGGSQPLIIVDGIPRSFNMLDPNTIETITVLKDAAAVAPYGVAGANGVLLITTKRGKSGAPSLSYNGYVGFQNPTVTPDLVNSVQYAELRNAASANEGLPPRFTAEEIEKFKNGSDPDLYANSNVIKELYEKNTILSGHNIEISGGTDKVKYYASLGYLYVEGIYKPTTQQRYNLDLKVDAQVTNTTLLSMSVTGIQQKNNYSALESDRLQYLNQTSLPIRPIRFSNGLNADFAYGSIHGSGYRKLDATQIYAQMSIEQKLPFISGLSFRGTLAYDPRYELNKTWTTPVHIWSLDATQDPRVYLDNTFGAIKPSLYQSAINSKQLTLQASLNYNKRVGKSNIGALFLYESKGNDNVYFEAGRINYNLDLAELSLGSSNQADISNAGYSNQARQMGLVYRVTYDYQAKYLFEVSGRYDGSYYFAPDNRFGFFPAFSAGWRLSEENFIKNNFTAIDNLKIRGSYGESGALAGTPFQYLNTFSVYGPASAIGGVGTQGVRTGIEANPNITWERAKKSNIGFEASIWKGLLNFEVDYFFEKRSNMLVTPDVTVPLEYGISLSQVNQGIMQNRGVDLSVSTVHQLSKDLTISIGGNLTYAKNRLLQVFETPATYNNPNRRITGRSLGVYFGYDALGYYQEADFDGSGNLKAGTATPPSGAVLPGDIKYRDVNGDGIIDINDYTQIGEPLTPQIIYGFSPRISYKTLVIDLLFQGAAKTSFYGTGTYNWPFFNNASAYVENLDYWTPTNTDAKFPRITNAPTANNSLTSSFWMHDATYLRLKSATISYNLPLRVLQNMKIQNVRIYVAGQNLITMTKVKNYDPENINQNGHGYPQQKVVSVGLNITF